MLTVNRVVGIFGMTIVAWTAPLANGGDDRVVLKKALRSEFLAKAAILSEVREQLMTEVKCAVVTARREMNLSVEEARAISVEHARKLAAEVKEATRGRGRKEL
jgi:hypothetical protein